MCIRDRDKSVDELESESWRLRWQHVLSITVNALSNDFYKLTDGPCVCTAFPSSQSHLMADRLPCCQLPSLITQGCADCGILEWISFPKWPTEWPKKVRTPSTQIRSGDSSRYINLVVVVVVLVVVLFIQDHILLKIAILRSLKSYRSYRRSH